MPAIHIDQPNALYDRPIAITIDGFRANEVVELVSSRRDARGVTFLRAWARFRADPQGVVDLTAQAPLEGSYGGVSPMGLFWSMEQVTKPEGLELDIAESRTVSLEAHSFKGDRKAQRYVQRFFTGPGVTNRWVREDGVIGRFFVPPGGGPHPAMIVLTGSSGGLEELDAALFASHGFAALALGYFALEGLPSTLDLIPLEYFAKAIAWLGAQPEVEGDVIGVSGVSRGGELALLLGATFPDIRAVVGYAASGVIHAGLVECDENGEDGPAWTLAGEPLPWLQHDNTCTDEDSIDIADPPVACTPVFESSLRDTEAIERAMIPVERINGPVLLISGSDDQMWPSAAMADLAVQRLTQHSHPYRVEHLIYAGAGHLIGPPFFPTTRRHSFHDILEINFKYGGSAAADARACIDSWPKVLSFLQAAARRHYDAT